MPDPARNLLVAGGCGFIGSHFVNQRIIEGHRVVVLDALTYAGHRENLKHITGPGSLELVVGDIGDGPLVKKLLADFKIDALINFAAESHVDRSIEEPARFVETNISGTYTLLAAALDYWSTIEDPAQKNLFRFIQISTDEVYGSLGSTGQFHESLRYSPNSPYSASKAAGDHLVHAWHHTYGLPTVVTHCSNNFGPRQLPEKLIPHMIQCALHAKPLPIYGDGGHIRDWIHVEDHCTGVWLALTRGKVGATYCLGGHSERSNLEVVKTICQALDRLHPRRDGRPHESAIQFVADRPGHDRRYSIDDSFAQKTLGFSLKHRDFEAELIRTIQWYLDNEAWISRVQAT